MSDLSPPDFVPASAVDPAAMERFLAHCERRTIPRKHLIVRKGDPADTLYYLVSGRAAVLLEDEDDNGHEIILAYLNGGEFIGEIGLFYRSSRRTTQVRARSDCELAQISYDALNALFETELQDVHAALLHAVGQQLSQRLIRTSRKVSQLAFMDVAGRVARTLLELRDAPEALSHPEGTQIHISRQEIARIVGCSREMAGRVLKNLAEQDMIKVSGMDIVLLHPR